MSEIDWSKAPEGATHWGPDTEEWSRAWRIIQGEQMAVMLDDGVDTEWAWYPITDDHREDLFPTLVARPTAWNGEGLPPAGTVCEYNLGGEWVEVEVFAHRPSDANRGTDAIFDMKPSARWMYSCRPERFRPLRTPEQIAAEEQEKAIAEMLAACPYPGSPVSRADCEHLYKAGYRKTEGGAA